MAESTVRELTSQLREALQGRGAELNEGSLYKFLRTLNNMICNPGLDEQDASELAEVFGQLKGAMKLLKRAYHKKKRKQHYGEMSKLKKKHKELESCSDSAQQDKIDSNRQQELEALAAKLATHMRRKKYHSLGHVRTYKK